MGESNAALEKSTISFAESLAYRLCDRAFGSLSTEDKLESIFNEMYDYEDSFMWWTELVQVDNSVELTTACLQTKLQYTIGWILFEEMCLLIGARPKRNVKSTKHILTRGFSNVANELTDFVYDAVSGSSAEEGLCDNASSFFVSLSAGELKQVYAHQRPAAAVAKTSATATGTKEAARKKMRPLRHSLRDATPQKICRSEARMPTRSCLKTKFMAFIGERVLWWLCPPKTVFLETKDKEVARLLASTFFTSIGPLDETTQRDCEWKKNMLATQALVHRDLRKQKSRIAQLYNSAKRTKSKFARKQLSIVRQMYGPR